MSNELIHDIEDSIRQERLRALWKEYAPYIFGGILIAIVLTGVTTTYRSWDAKQNAQSTAILLQAMENDGNVAQLLSEAAAQLRPNHRALAYLSEAGIHLRDGNRSEALDVFKTAEADKKLPRLYHDLATLQAIRIEWSTKAEGVTTDDLLARLKPIAQRKNSPWHGQALIQSALIKAHDNNDYAGARADLKTIIESDKFTDPIKTRAASLDQIFALKNSAEAPKESE